MSTNTTQRKVAYGLSGPLLNVPLGALVSKRAPTVNDKAPFGQLWVDQTTRAVYFLVAMANNQAIWLNPAAGGTITLAGNTGSVTGDPLTITTGTANAQGTALFHAAGSAVTLSFSDALDNTGVGASTLASGALTGQENAAFGATAGNALTTGSFNTFIGQNAGLSAISSTDSTAVGFAALNSITAGTNNTCIGHAAGSNYTTTESNNVCINSEGIIGESNTLRIGQATGTAAGDINQSFIAGITGIVVTGAAVLVSTANQLGVAASSSRFKNNIENMGSASDELLKLRPVTFTWNKASSSGLKHASEQKQYGLIAEEVAKVLPQLVTKDQEGKPFSVNYQDLSPLLLNELQKAVTRIANLEQKIRALASVNQ